MLTRNGVQALVHNLHQKWKVDYFKKAECLTVILSKDIYSLAFNLCLNLGIGRLFVC